MQVHELTAERSAIIKQSYAEWLAVGLCTDPVDWKRAETALTKLYARTGRSAPRFIHLRSPMEAELYINALKITSSPEYRVVLKNKINLELSKNTDACMDVVSAIDDLRMSMINDGATIADIAGMMFRVASDDIKAKLKDVKLEEIGDALRRVMFPLTLSASIASALTTFRYLNLGSDSDSEMAHDVAASVRDRFNDVNSDFMYMMGDAQLYRQLSNALFKELLHNTPVFNGEPVADKIGDDLKLDEARLTSLISDLMNKAVHDGAMSGATFFESLRTKVGMEHLSDSDAFNRADMIDDEVQHDLERADLLKAGGDVSLLSQLIYHMANMRAGVLEPGDSNKGFEVRNALRADLVKLSDVSSPHDPSIGSSRLVAMMDSLMSMLLPDMRRFVRNAIGDNSRGMGTQENNGALRDAVRADLSHVQNLMHDSVVDGLRRGTPTGALSDAVLNDDIMRRANVAVSNGAVEDSIREALPNLSKDTSDAIRYDSKVIADNAHARRAVGFNLKDSLSESSRMGRLRNAVQADIHSKLPNLAEDTQAAMRGDAIVTAQQASYVAHTSLSPGGTDVPDHLHTRTGRIATAVQADMQEAFAAPDLDKTVMQALYETMVSALGSVVSRELGGKTDSALEDGADDIALNNDIHTVGGATGERLNALREELKRAPRNEASLDIDHIFGTLEIPSMQIAFADALTGLVSMMASDMRQAVQRDMLVRATEEALREHLKTNKLTYTGTYFWGSWDTYMWGYYDTGRKVGAVYPPDVNSALDDHCAISKSCGWVYPFADFCIVTDRAEVIKRDDQNRLHCDDGPAIRYRDGYSLYCLHGVRIPAHVIEAPNTITLKEISAERNAEVRRVMIERYGAARYIKDSGANLVDNDPRWGQLYIKERKDDTDMVMLKVVNSSPEPDGTFREYWLRIHPSFRPIMKVDGKLVTGDPQKRTALNAVASTFGMTGAQYADLLGEET